MVPIRKPLRREEEEIIPTPGEEPIVFPEEEPEEPAEKPVREPVKEPERVPG